MGNPWEELKKVADNPSHAVSDISNGFNRNAQDFTDNMARSDFGKAIGTSTGFLTGSRNALNSIFSGDWEKAKNQWLGGLTYQLNGFQQLQDASSTARDVTDHNDIFSLGGHRESDKNAGAISKRLMDTGENKNGDYEDLFNNEQQKIVISAAVYGGYEAGAYAAGGEGAAGAGAADAAGFSAAGEGTSYVALAEGGTDAAGFSTIGGTSSGWGASEYLAAANVGSLVLKGDYQGAAKSLGAPSYLADYLPNGEIPQGARFPASSDPVGGTFSAQKSSGSILLIVAALGLGYYLLRKK